MPRKPTYEELEGLKKMDLTNNQPTSLVYLSGLENVPPLRMTV